MYIFLHPFFRWCGHAISNTAFPLCTHVCMCMWHMEARSRCLVSLTHNHSLLLRLRHSLNQEHADSGTWTASMLVSASQELKTVCHGVTGPHTCTTSTLLRGISPGSKPPTFISLLASASNASKPSFPTQPHYSSMSNLSPPVFTLGKLVLRDLELQSHSWLLGIKTTTRARSLKPQFSLVPKIATACSYWLITSIA